MGSNDSKSFMAQGIPTRIMLSDDHPFVRRGLRNILESSSQYEVCGEAGDGTLALELEEMLRAAAAVGASGYLLKSDAEELLVVALRRLEEGLRFVSPSFDANLVRQLFE